MKLQTTGGGGASEQHPPADRLLPSATVAHDSANDSRATTRRRVTCVRQVISPAVTLMTLRAGVCVASPSCAMLVAIVAFNFVSTSAPNLSKFRSCLESES